MSLARYDGKLNNLYDSHRPVLVTQPNQISRPLYGGSQSSNLDLYRHSRRNMNGHYEAFEGFRSGTSPSSESDGKGGGHQRKRIAVAVSSHQS